MEYGTLTAARN